jgi:hypothetical protein
VKKTALALGELIESIEIDFPRRPAPELPQGGNEGGFGISRRWPRAFWLRPTDGSGVRFASEAWRRRCGLASSNLSRGKEADLEARRASGRSAGERRPPSTTALDSSLPLEVSRNLLRAFLTDEGYPFSARGSRATISLASGRLSR